MRPRFALLGLCEIAQYEAHLHLGDEPLCINPAGVDYLWRAAIGNELWVSCA